MKLIPLILMLTAAPLLANPLRPSCDAVASFIADTPAASPSKQFESFTVTRADLCDILSKYFEVTENQWLHTYHHVAFADRTGTITLDNGAVVRWLVRPGGLARLNYPDGGTMFLAREKHNEPRSAQ